MNDKPLVIYVCDMCGKQCKSDIETEAHTGLTGHKTYTPIPPEPEGVESRMLIDPKESFNATVIDVSDEVQDKIAERVVKLLIKREEEAAKDLIKLYGTPPSALSQMKMKLPKYEHTLHNDKKKSE